MKRIEMLTVIETSTYDDNGTDNANENINKDSDTTENIDNKEDD